MNKENNFFDKITTITTIVCIAILTIAGTLLLNMESKNNSSIIKAETSAQIEADIDRAIVSKENSSGEYDADLYGLININTADKDLLMKLNGIGEKRANDIIEYRSKHPFKKIEDIMNIKGIGKKTFENIKNLICVE